ncbi:MAG: hypothetical protein ACOYEV_05075 [Candidatus Nanopelagicales bacterium]
MSAPIETGTLSAKDITALLDRVAKLESQVAELRAAAGSEVPRDVVLTITAAVAAYLGKHATVKQIRRTGDTTWARAGRSYVQGSHARRR